MIRPMPNNHDPNPAAVPIEEAIKETFRVFMAHPRLLDTIRTLVLFRPDSAKLGYTLQLFLEAGRARRRVPSPKRASINLFMLASTRRGRPHRSWMARCQNVVEIFVCLR
jgi:hypothetical protein